ncbi:9405_t:CDS:1 [Cetraspora pellucida]|uniref:9405_t:CDS:1 n=1 Tax=Cetraspora pellucida TaxID=1433469 RepID=A0ACA9LYI0_9GLOM|nr:9405_t:CDS:1 [Cetraspora pellucida]
MARKIADGGPKVEVDENQKHDLPMQPDSAKENLKYTKMIVDLAGEQNINLAQYEIFILNSLGADRFRKEREIAWGKIGGKSAGSVLYLAVLSALTKKPISAQVAATGAIAEEAIKGKINGQEITLEKGTNLPIKSLREKTKASNEKGINHLVLSFYQSSPNLLLEYYEAK